MIKLLIIIIPSLSLAESHGLMFDMRIDKLVYSKDDDVRICLSFKNQGHKDMELAVKVIISKELKTIFSKNVRFRVNRGEQKKIEVIYKPEGEFGYRVLAEVYDNKEFLQEKTGFFEVLSDWTRSIRMGTGIAGLPLRFYLTPYTENYKLVELAENMKNYGINFVQFYDIAPNYGVLTTSNEIYITPRDYPKHYPARIKIS